MTAINNQGQQEFYIRDAQHAQMIIDLYEDCCGWCPECGLTVGGRSCSDLYRRAKEYIDAHKEENPHHLDCGTCQEFINQKCETHFDCRWLHECAKLGHVWKPRKEADK